MLLEKINLVNGLILHPVRHGRDAAGFIALNEVVTGEGHICQRLLHHHPATTDDDYFVVEDTGRGEVISTTVFIPWQLVYEGVYLKTAMLEMVVTHPDYRHRGLVRAQINHFHNRVEERNFDISLIQGVPYFYRQFGYAYALDHHPVHALPTSQIPDALPGKTSLYTLRPAGVEDVGVLNNLYQSHMRRHALYTHRDESYWRYLMQSARYPVNLMVDTGAGLVVGYICTEVSAAQQTRILESVIESHEQGLAVLTWLKTQASGEIQIVGSESTTLVGIARSFGSRRVSSEQWLVRVSSFPRLLKTIGPVLERRLSRSDYASFTAELTLNLYREAYRLRFTKGHLSGVDSLGFVDTSMGSGANGGDLWIPPEALIRLLFGYRGFDDLLDAWPDIVVKTGTRALWDVMFPRMDSLILTPY